MRSFAKQEPTRRPIVVSPHISERSGIAVKGLTLAPHDAMTLGRTSAVADAHESNIPVGGNQTMTKKTEIDPSRPPLKPSTRLVVGGRDPAAYHGFVNPPVYHASTVLYPSAEDFLARRARYLYGRRGTPTSEALEDALRELEGPDCAGVALLPSGLAAISTALLSVLNAGDHVLVTDSVYLPTRRFCDGVLTRYGIATTYYDPLIGAGIAELMQPRTRAVR